ncbi:hydrolase of alpha/beta hydrolase fold family [alpha proteobacterium U9-1i]|nr:hydrolase of alpha/beta hydrolase fold family [alpha proteobacterium U9-1i]
MFGEMPMKRRSIVAAALGILLAACASTGGDTELSQLPGDQLAPFQSDRISVVVQGAGPDVILIPGLTSHREIWDTTAAALDDRYRVHLVQVNGFAGYEPQGNADGPVSAPVAEEINRYIAEMHLARPAVIGHSMGGTIGLMLAARHPDAVGKLMVVDMFPFMGAMFGGQTADAVRPTADIIRDQMVAAPAPMRRSILEQTINSMTMTESERPRLLQHALDSDVRVNASAFHELIVTDLREEIANIRVPLKVLYVIPPQAPISPAQYDAYFHASYARAPQAQLVKIENSWHFIMIDQFDVFMREVNGFLAD